MRGCFPFSLNAIWLEDGTKLLDYMEADERFNAASFKESLEEQGIFINQTDLSALIDNMRGLVKQWRSSIGERGELVFYIDACCSAVLARSPRRKKSR